MIYENLPAIALSWETFRTLWILLPLLPAAGIILMLIANYILPGDPTGTIFHGTLCAQILLGGLILSAAGTIGADPHEIAVSLWEYAIVFRVDRLKLIHLGILMVPLVLALPKYHSIDSPYLRIIFLFFLAGCSGVIVTGDMFNLFVFYELMIMAAYVLVAAKHHFAEAIKYMMFGSISSITFLGGIIVLYAGGAPFTIHTESYAAIPEANAWWAMVLFTVAFGVKSAFFPIALAPCHAAAGSIFSAFLASFTIFTGMIGLHYFVLQPAALLEMPAFFSLIRTLSVLTIVMPSLILFWEPAYNRAVAQSTIIAIGITGLLLSYGAQEYAFLYVGVHAVYKSLLFLLGDTLKQTARTLQADSWLAILMLGIGVFLAAGITPGLTAHFKASLDPMPFWIQAALLLSGFCVIGGFCKFRYSCNTKANQHAQTWRSYLLYSLFVSMILLLYCQLGLPSLRYAGTVMEFSALGAALLIGKRIYRAFPAMISMDRHWIYGSLNRQLFYIILLFSFVLIWLYPTSRRLEKKGLSVPNSSIFCTFPGCGEATETHPALQPMPLGMQRVTASSEPNEQLQVPAGHAVLVESIPDL